MTKSLIRKSLVKYFLLLIIISYQEFVKAHTLSSPNSNQIYYNNQHYNKNYNQESDQNLELFKQFLNPIRPTHSSIKNFLVNTFNNNYYSEFLALDFSHVTSLLSFYNQTQEPKRYIRSILRLFSQKIKSTTYINSYAFLSFLDQLAPVLYPLFTKNPTQKSFANSKQDIKPQVKEYLYNYFLNNFQNFKQNPNQELDKISTELSNIAIENLSLNKSLESQDISTEELQNHIIRFLELSLNKLIWSPKDQIDSWTCLKNISQRLEKLMINGIVPDIETFNETCWSLVQRYCYFLEMFGSELEIKAIETIAKELKDKQLALWSVEEQESLTTSKKSCLKKALFTAHASNKASQLKLLSSLSN